MSERKPLDLEKKLNFIFHNIEDELLWRLEKKKLNKTEIRSILKGSKEYLLKEIKQRIQEAVQGLLKEIEEDIAYWKKVMEEYEEKELNAKTEEERKEYDEYWKIAEQVHRVLNTRIKYLIKKYFPEEVKENEK